MTTDRTETEPFARFRRQARGVLGFWARFVGGSVALMLAVGVIAPLALVALLFTVGLPILILVLWGHSLDAELGWGEPDEGPW